ncbi:MAG: phosphoribosylaminoimidazolesuccinocarboxamide synthase [Phycisphaeraceae bacterium]
MPPTTAAVMSTDLPLPGRRQGKVRDIYDARTTAGVDALVIVASDRISAFDVVLANPIPDKGRMLTQLSAFWFDMIGRSLGDRLEHHLISTDPADIAGLSDRDRQTLRGRVMVGRKTRVVPIECVVRGYLAGSGWKEYQKSGAVTGIALPAGLRQCDKLPQPIFTPSTKAETGHDENITFEEACDVAGAELMGQLRELSLAIYRMGHDYAAQRGIILADTKFEFGLPLEDETKRPILIDEALTPDSSRFWPADEYEPGRDQPSFDKQYVRNYLQALVDGGRWDKQPPGPELPDEVIRNTREKYLEAYRQITQRELEI